MPEKVILTKKQAEVIEKLKKFMNPMNTVIKYKESWSASYPSLYELSYDDIAKALYVGYDIKSDLLILKPGDRSMTEGKQLN